MKSRPIGTDQDILASHQNDKRDDARAGSFLLAHQQLGVLALSTAPTNGQTVSFVINGTTVTVTASASPANPNDIYNPGTAAGFVTNLINWLRRPDLTTSNQIAASIANQTLLSYVGWAWPGSSTTIVPFSLNKNVNGIAGGLTSFNITTTVTSGSWTAQTMQLYVEDGTYYIGTTRVLFTGGSTPTVTAPVSHPRIDVLSINSSGTLSWTTGTESATPSAPTYPTGQIVICELYNVVGETALYDNENQQSNQGYIYNDVRPVLGGTYISSASQVASGLFIPDPGSEAQGDILYYNGTSWALLAPGTSGNALVTKGASANPVWANAAPTNVGFIAPGTGASGTWGSFHVVASVSNIPALSTNQTLWIRGYLALGNDTTGNTDTLGFQAGSTMLWSGSGASANPWNVYFDLFFLATTPASAQTYFGTVAVNNTTPSYVTGTTAANLGSTWTLNIGGFSNGGRTISIAVGALWAYILS